MFCALIKFLEYFKDLKQLGRFTSNDISVSVGRGMGWGKTKYCKNVIGAQNMLVCFRLYCLYIQRGGGDAFKTNLLKKTLLSYASASI